MLKIRTLLLSIGAVFFVSLIQAKELDYVLDVAPVLTKSGCNTGECHGAATGQGGFRLSLLGYDPKLDYERLTRELFARRIDVQDPASSLMLRKPTRELKHKGGRLFNSKSLEYKKLLEWIQSGAPYGDEDLTITKLQVEPGQVVVDSPEAVTPLKVTAWLNDGRTQDVTRWALFTMEDDSMGAVDEEGLLRLNRPGVTSVMIRYSGQVAAVRAIYPIENELPSKVEDPKPTESDLDKTLRQQFEILNLVPASTSSASMFLRRACLTLAGRLPSEEEVRDWLVSEDTDERRKNKIESLLEEDGYTDLWTYRLAEALRISSKNQGPTAYEAYHNWLRDQVSANRPWNEIVRELLTASGQVDATGPAAFYRLTQDPRDMGEFVSQTILGMRLACARCHHHPFDRWSVEDYYSFASWFSQTAWEGNSIVLKSRGEVEHPKTGMAMTPAFPGATSTGAVDPVDRRVTLADWVTKSEPDLMARALVNRVWKWMMGQGLVEPVDDLRPTNPAAHPEILEQLTEKFVASGFDLKELIQTIANSAAFQYSSLPGGADYAGQGFFSRFNPNPIKGVLLADALSDATGASWEFTKTGQTGLTQRAVQLQDPATESYTLEVLGRCSREEACATPEDLGGGLSMALRFLNGADLNEIIRSGWLSELLEEEHAPALALEKIYLRTLSRFPSERELSYWTTRAVEAEDARTFFESLMWAALNSREFLFIH
jgi:hypothetical protein